MIDILIKREGNILECVQHEEIQVGSRFKIGLDKNNKPLIAKIDSIIEQRKEKGKYDDESKRRHWAKIVWEYV